MSRLILSIALTVSVTHAIAVEQHYQGLNHPDLVGMSSLDGYWNNGNDVNVAGFGLNPSGSASSFSSSDGTFGFYPTATSVTENDLNGTYSYLSRDATSELSAANLSFTNFPYTATLSATGSNSGTYDEVTQLFEDDYDVLSTSDNGLFEFIVRTHSSGVYIYNGQDPADFIVDPNLLTHVSYLLTLLPDNWSIFVAALESYAVLDATTLAPTGITGLTSTASFSVVPLPTALPLFAAALGGLFGLRRILRRSTR